MTTREFHVGIDLELQKIDAAVTVDIQPQEKDWFINKEVLKFINKKMSPHSNVTKTGFEDTFKRIDDLKELKRTATRPITINSAGRGEVYLPADCFKHIRTDVISAKDCGIPIVESTQNEYRVEIPINITASTLSTFNVDISISTGQKRLFSLTDLPTGYLQPGAFAKQKFMLIKALKILLPKKLKTTLTSSFDLYWEFDRKDYKPNTFILYSNQQLFNSIVAVNSTVTPTAASSVPVKVYTPSKYPIGGKVRITDDEFFSDAERSHLSKSQISSLLGRQHGQIVEISIPDNTVLGNAVITYLCRPQLADLLLESNVNMSTNSLDEILANTVAYIKAVIESGNYQAYKQESILVE